MTLPSSGWRGYGRPGYIPAALREWRRLAYDHDEAAQEAGFQRWVVETVWAQAVCRWIREACRG